MAQGAKRHTVINVITAVRPQSAFNQMVCVNGGLTTIDAHVIVALED
jgi:hypothetical protein